MKKNLKKLSSLSLVLALVFSLSVSAFAADISADKAKEIALGKAGVAAEDVLNLRAKLEYDDGVKYYDVGFLVPQADGSYLEYDYDIGAADGKVYDYDVDREGRANAEAKPNENKVVNGGDIGLAEAKKAALAHFGVKESEVKFYEARREYDDGVLVYDLAFAKGYDVKYSCEVVAANGFVKDAEKEAVRGFDVIELFFEILFFSLFKR